MLRSRHLLRLGITRKRRAGVVIFGVNYRILLRDSFRRAERVPRKHAEKLRGGRAATIKREPLYGRHRGEHRAPSDEYERIRMYIQRNYVIVSQNRGLRD